MLLTPAESHKKKPGQSDELTQYLESGTLPVAPCAFWKDHQDEFPVLASLAQDVLSILATGAGVEQLFNSAHDVCHYSQGSLNSKTIQDLMMFMCTTKFDIEEKELAFIDQFLSREEREAANEEKEAQGQDDLNPISNNEEDDSVCIQDQLQLSLNKRQRNTTPATSESEVDLPLPTNLHKGGNIQQCMSGRAWKRSRLLDGFELGQG